MRGGVMASWLGVVTVVAVVCLVAVTAEDPRAVGEFVVVHRHFPRRVRVVSDVASQESRIGFRGRGVERVNGDGEKRQWNFNPFNPFQTFEVRREGHGHKKCGMASKMGSWLSNMFGQGREHHHDYYHHHHHEHEHEHRFERTMGHHHELSSSFGWGLLRKIGRWFSGIPSFFSDVPNLIRIWSARASGRKPPTVESVTEPLDMHALQKISSPSLSCSLRDKLSHVFATVSEEIAATTGSSDKDDTQSDLVKRNLKKFMGDSMQLKIVKDVCDTSSMSSCEQEFCDVFLSHPRSGVLMAFRVVGLNPVRAAMNPERVAALLVSSKFQSKSVMTKSEMAMFMNLKKARALANIVYQGVLTANPTEENVPTLTHELKNVFGKTFGGELNRCKACLRQEIFRLKKLTKKVMTEVCEYSADSHLEEACNFAKENRFVFKTLFAYKFRLWEMATSVCKDRKACDSLPTPSAGSSEQSVNTLVTKEVHKLQLSHIDANTFRNPRGMAVSPVMASFMHWRGQNCRQRALHKAAMLRGHSLDAIATELLKGDDGLSLQPGNGALIVVDFVARPQFELNHELNAIPLPMDLSSPKKWNFFHGTMNMEELDMQTFEPKFAGSLELEPFSDFLKRPVFDSSPMHVGTVMEDSIAKPHNVPPAAPDATGISLELLSSNGANVERSNM